MTDENLCSILNTAILLTFFPEIANFRHFNALRPLFPQHTRQFEHRGEVRNHGSGRGGSVV